MMMPPFPFSLPNVRVLRDVSEQMLRRSVFAFEPVVLRDALTRWSLFQELRQASSVLAKMSLLMPHLGERPARFTATHTKDGGYLGYAEDLCSRNTPMLSAPLEEFGRRLERAHVGADDEVLYLQSRAVEWMGPLAAELRRLASTLQLATGRANLWVGSGGQVVNLHHDDKLNFICVLEGVKRVALFPPEACGDLYPGPLDSSLGAPASYVRLLRPDPAQFPRFSRALQHAQLAVLEGGDILCLPPFWWHHVESYGFNVMLNGWFATGPSEAEDAIKRELRRAIVLFAGLAAEERLHYRAVYHEALFNDVMDGSRASTALPLDILANLQRCAGALGRLPSYWRRALRPLFDYYAFWTEGEPMSRSPGAFAQMVERFSGTAVAAEDRGASARFASRDFVS